MDNGMDTMEKIAHQTGATTGCGSCDVLLLELLAQQCEITSAG
jgi:NAD(P)H-nitrite reductase large subunit